ncbi:uncharacterized protein LOC136040926 isoform X3 [Artemia franciscana]|uniref:uncharacterized protein LOC136040926 isoform X3 n=1 Tax=Artemia franciscana TaxID=6661 RepID=UPI0032DA9E0D
MKEIGLCLACGAVAFPQGNYFRDETSVSRSKSDRGKYEPNTYRARKRQSYAPGGYEQLPNPRPYSSPVYDEEIKPSASAKAFEEPIQDYKPTPTYKERRRAPSYKTEPSYKAEPSYSQEQYKEASQDYASEDYYENPEQASFAKEVQSVASSYVPSESKGYARGAGNDGRLSFAIHGQQGPHSYKYGFDTGSIGPDRQFRFEERDSAGVVHGRYGYYDSKGKLRIVNYKADPVHGFSADAGR